MRELRVCIDVDDLDRAADFYGRAFGLVPRRRLGADWLEMVGASAVIDLLAVPAGSPSSDAAPAARRDYRRHWTPVHLDFVVDDLDAAVARATRAGATLDRPIQTRVWGRQANMADPFGHGLCILEMNAEGYDALLRDPGGG